MRITSKIQDKNIKHKDKRVNVEISELNDKKVQTLRREARNVAIQLNTASSKRKKYRRQCPQRFSTVSRPRLHEVWTSSHSSYSGAAVDCHRRKRKGLEERASFCCWVKWGAEPLKLTSLCGNCLLSRRRKMRRNMAVSRRRIRKRQSTLNAEDDIRTISKWEICGNP